MRVTAADLAGLKRKQAQPQRAEGELLAVWVAGKLVNTKNARLHWKSEMSYKREWRRRIAVALFEAVPWAGTPNGRDPKRIAILCNVHGLMDSHDGLRVACAPIVDALKECGVIHSDAHDCGHLFEYGQRIDRARRGVEIRVSLRAPAHERSECDPHGTASRGARGEG